MTLVQKKIAIVYLGDVKVWPAETIATYDFTTSNVLTFVARQNSYTGYGWTSGSGYYSSIGRSSSYRTNVTYSLPDSMYTGGTLKRIEVTLNIPNLYSGGGISVNTNNDQAITLGATNTNSTNMISQYNSYSSYTYSTGIQTFVIDIENLQLYMSGGTSTAVTLNSTYATNIQTAWTNKALYFNVVCNNGSSGGVGTYTYLRGATFVTI